LEEIGLPINYSRIFHTNPHAQKLTTTYVDAFAGTGYRTKTRLSSDRQPQLLFEPDDPDAKEYLKGSARIALEVEPSFNHYLFIDKNPLYVQELEKLKEQFPQKASRIKIKQADANIYLSDWCSRGDWRYNRAVVFLDPYGMQIDWNLITIIAKTQAIDLWLLFPLGVAVNRLLKKGEPPEEEWANALTRIFGTDEWITVFYPHQKILTLFGEEDIQCKQAEFDQIGNFLIERLKKVFIGVADTALQLCNSKHNPIYLLCFAAGNPKGSQTAVRIAKYIIEKKR
jgi:three-Cys-motif partner protein